MAGTSDSGECRMNRQALMVFPGGRVAAWIASVVGATLRRHAVEPVVISGERPAGFAAQVNELDRCLSRCEMSVGHGFGGWLLMAAAEQRMRRGDSLPPLLLLNPVLGSSQHLNGSLIGYRAPRSERVRAAFGLDPNDGAVRLVQRVEFVFGDNDRFSSEQDWRYLRGLGYEVQLIYGWHERHSHEVGLRLESVVEDYIASLPEEAAPSADQELPLLAANEG